MAEKKYTEHLGLTQQAEEDFVDGEEISRSFRVLDGKVWKNTVDMDNAKQELYKKIGNIQANDCFEYTIETITYGDKGYIAFGYKDGETQSFTYLTSTNAKEWQNVGYTDRIKHLEYLDSGTYIGATNANMIHYLYGESGEFTQFPTSQNWEVNKIKAFGSRALIIGSKIIRAYMDYTLDLYTLGVLPDEPLIDIVKINDEDKFVGCTEHIVYEYQNLIGSGTETQELIFEKNDEVISSILFKDNRLYYTTQSGNIYRSEPEHYTLMVKVAEGFETGKNKLIHYSGMFLLQTEHNVYTSTDCKEWKTTLTTNKKFNNAKYVNDKFAICGDEGVKFLSIEKSLKEQVDELNSALVDTPVWVVPTQMNGRCSITGGGYYTRGKKVCVQLTITTLVDLTGGDYRTMFAGLPIADGNRSVAISCAIFNAGFAISGYINSAGALCINAPNTITKGSEIIITGNYYSA